MNILEKIIVYEVVYVIYSWDDLWVCLKLLDWCFFVFFYLVMLDELLIFVEVVFIKGVLSFV